MIRLALNGSEVSMLFRSLSRSLLVLMLLGLASQQARAQMPPGGPGPAWLINPTGPHAPFTGPSSASTNGYTYSAVVATTALPWSVDVSLFDILSTQNINAASGWNITNFNLQGNGTVTSYYAFAGGGSGGIDFRLSYTAAGTDPAAARWLQVIHTNYPLNNGLPKITDVDGSSWYIDNAPNPGNPFYDASYDAGATYFHDAPSRPTMDQSYWRGYLFVATGDVATKQLGISTIGVYYGFDDPISAVPEPSTILMILLVTMAAFAYRYKRRVAGLFAFRRRRFSAV